MKSSRTLIVIAVAVVTAGIATYGVYQAVQRMPVREVEVASVPVVVARDYIPVGTQLTADHLRVVAWPSRNRVPGAFSDPKTLVNRGVIATLGPNEPVTESKVAGTEAGAGLPPIIPPGMRAMSVRVNEVIGVAGFVLPGTRVDVLVTVDDDSDGNNKAEPMSRTVVSNVQVLTAGTRTDQQEARGGQPQRSTVVTLAVLPEDGERIALASSKGTVSLALRNPVDVAPTETKGIKMGALMRGTGPEPMVVDRVTRRVAPAKPSVSAVPPPPPVYRVETIRAAKRSEEVVR
jgi:pilus assembly protein CpaB